MSAQTPLTTKHDAATCRVENCPVCIEWIQYYGGQPVNQTPTTATPTTADERARLADICADGGIPIVGTQLLKRLLADVERLEGQLEKCAYRSAGFQHALTALQEAVAQVRTWLVDEIQDAAGQPGMAFTKRPNRLEALADVWQRLPASPVETEKSK